MQTVDEISSKDRADKEITPMCGGGSWKFTLGADFSAFKGGGGRDFDLRLATVSIKERTSKIQQYAFLFRG